ncbi:Putative CBS domain and cyclic nucleotide-regulated nucleotidyltransferase [Cyclobacterium amurskyense]|uniref:Putative CBS domain and cyclic nucleotide-regulated nucleotidyltransferase n=2 Tax=Cyclobacterium amurskyense TaxID=320787 RepID=A0A0H4PDL8_9BACT|nr:Putative CBS domain and cyclic nucleotide-regulated nucleotidyltransferase [Cyclobacterium amurskyense]
MPYIYFSQTNSHMSNVIVNRVIDFLKKFPPFSFLSPELLSQVAKEVDLVYFEKDEFLFQKGEPAKNYFFVVKDGAVKLTDFIDGEEQTIELCDEGDVFGVLALLGKRPYILNAKANENSLVMAVPVGIFDKILLENSQVSLYFASGFASGQVVVRSDLSQTQKVRSLLVNNSHQNGLLLFPGQAAINYSQPVIQCRIGETIAQAVGKMSADKVGSIVIVDENNHPQGIITDKDLRNRLIAKGLPYDTLVEKIMSYPVITAKKDLEFSQIYLNMVKNRLHHLVFTEDGTNQSKLIGIISDHDILLSQGNSPAVLIKALQDSSDVHEIAKLRNQAEGMLIYFLENELAIDFIAGIITEINDTIIQRAIHIAKSRHSADFPEVCETPFCFLGLGSEGRGEQLLRTDIDNAMVYEDVPEALEENTRRFMHLIARDVMDILFASGFHSCPAEMMANNPEWCQPLSKWKSYFSHWISKPDQQSLLMASIFFDFRAIAGKAALAEALTAHVYEQISSEKIFLNFFAKNALLNPPPLGFFRNFIVEKSGAHAEKFDIKLRAMMPLADAARVLVLNHQVVGVNNTFKRYEKLAELEPNQAELYKDAGKAYEIFMRFRALEGLSASSSGRFIKPDSLGKLQRQLLKNAFFPIDEIQKILRVRFQLDYFGK